MGQLPTETKTVPGRLSRRLLVGWLKRRWRRLDRYRPPVKDRRFWTVQGIIVALVVVHYTIEITGLSSHLERLYFVLMSLFFVPVVYAAVNFGFAASVVTALWTAIIAIPNLILWHSGLERLGEAFQMAALLSVAVIVGHRVDRERDARRRAEATGAALGASEARYRSLFESSPIAILVLAPNADIIDANSAAGLLFGRAVETLRGTAVVELVGKAGEQKLLASAEPPKGRAASLLVHTLADGSEVYLEPMPTRVSDSQGNSALQVLLSDVTQERRRQAGLRAYTAYVLRAQEEERHRIARELHDDTIQTLILLCRRLGSVETTSQVLPAPVIEELREARKTGEKIVRDLRDFAKALRPPTLDDLGLVTSIRRLLMDSEGRSGIKVKLKLVGDEQRLSRDAEVGTYRIAQEALLNVERHSRASEVVATITFAEHEVMLSVSDNGVGFKVPPMPGGFSGDSRLGLIGMQERAELLGGKLAIQSSPEEGTTLTVSIPIEEGISSRHTLPGK